MKVKCIDNYDYFGELHLTIGKIYKIEKEISCWYYIKNDIGDIKHYYKTRFEIVKEEEN